MKLAFYAPLKGPEHPVPSGDRTMARGLIAALEAAGHKVHLASDLRIYDGLGDAAVQDRLFSQAAEEASRLLGHQDARTWRAWVTYHNYYKAPDLLGPIVARILKIPYLQIEATRARKRLEGPWARFGAAAETACDQARVIYYLTDRDAEALRVHKPEGQSLIHLPPFLAQTDLPAASDRSGPMLAVGMMRPGDKLASYALISETLALLGDMDWQLDIAGDGAARAEVEAMMARFGPRVRFLGKLDADGLAQAYAQAKLLFWPGVNEAFGLAYLEAQAHGVPVLAQDRPGVCDVVYAARPSVSEGPAAMARALRAWLDDPKTLSAAAEHARRAVADAHLLTAAAQTLTKGLDAAVEAGP